MHESESEVTQSCPTLSDPMDCSLPGSSIHGIFQARVLGIFRGVLNNSEPIVTSKDIITLCWSKKISVGIYKFMKKGYGLYTLLKKTKYIGKTTKTIKNLT